MARVALVNVAPDWGEAFALAAKQEGIEVVDTESPDSEGALIVASAFEQDQFPRGRTWIALVCGNSSKQARETRNALIAGAREVHTQPFSIVGMRKFLCALREGGLLSL